MTKTSSPRHQELADLLSECTVRVLSGCTCGTGFFVAPGLVLTCAHVTAEDSGGLILKWKTQTLTLEKVRTPGRLPQLCESAAQGALGVSEHSPDLALIQITETHHPCVLLFGAVQVNDDLVSFGYPSGDALQSQCSRGDPVTTLCEGITDNPRLLKFKEGQIQPGHSGSPVMNLRTGGVCGLISWTRGHQNIPGTLKPLILDIGGLGEPNAIILACFPELALMNARFHDHDHRWVRLLSSEQRRALEASSQCRWGTWADALSLQSPIALAVFTQQPHSPPFYGAWDYIGPAWAFVEAVAVDPHDQRIVYAGLGANKGVFRSDDAGVSWTPRCVGLGNLSVSAIAISHFDGTIFAGTDDGLFFSKDRCETWSRKNDRYCGMEVTRVVLSPHEPGFLLVGTREGGGASVSCGVGVGIDNSGLLKGSPSARSGHLHITRDSGASWLTYPFDTVNDACIASDDSRLVYVAGAHGGVLRTVDGFETCERLKNFPGKGPVCISLDPDDSRVVLVGTLREGLYQSFDAGATWNKIHCIGNVQVAQVFFAARHSKQVFAATRRGMFDSVDGGREWRPAIDGLTHEWCMSVASSKEGMVYCGTSGGGVYRRGVGQRNWISSVQGFPASPAIVLASGGRKTLFAGTPVGLFRSRDVGSTWQLIACAGEAVTAIVLRNTKAEHLPLGLSFGGLHISRDGGESIQESPAQGDAILEVHVGTYLGNVYRSGDSGRSWKKLTPPFGTDGASSGRQVRSLAVASSLPDQLYAVVEGAGIRRSTDGGINWGPFGAETCGESVISLCLSRHHERMIYAATQDRGLCASDDGGSTWFRVKDLEGQTIIEVVEPLGNGQLVYAVSLSRFVFKSRDGIHWEVLRSEREADSTSLQGKWATLAVSADGSKLALGSSAGAFLSLDGGSEWTPVSGGVLGMDYYVNHLLFADDKSGNLYAAMKHGICSSKVGGLRTTSVSASASMA